MPARLHCIGLFLLVSSSLGCAVCCSPDDYNYGAYGGRWERHDMSSGRVGSAFAEAGYDSIGDRIDAEAPTEPEARPGDDHIRPVNYEEVSSYIE